MHSGQVVIGHAHDDIHDVNSGSAHLYDISPIISPIIPIIDSERLLNQFVVTFSYAPNQSGWTIKGSADLSSFDDDLTASTAITEIQPGTYRAEIDIGASPPLHYFIRIER